MINTQRKYKNGYTLIHYDNNLDLGLINKGNTYYVGRYVEVDENNHLKWSVSNPFNSKYEAENYYYARIFNCFSAKQLVNISKYVFGSQKEILVAQKVDGYWM